MRLLEKYLEKKLRERVEKLGGKCLKWTSPGNRGVPDRIVLLPYGRMAFVEMKRPRGSVDPLQAYWHEQLRLLGFPVYVIYTTEDLVSAVQLFKRLCELPPPDVQYARMIGSLSDELRAIQSEHNRMIAKCNTCFVGEWEGDT